MWHQLEQPTIEQLGIRTDVVHALHPLLIPSRRAAQVITIHDLFFLTHPSATDAEIRRDYARLAESHARRADAIVTNSKYTASLVESTFGIPQNRIHICSPGPPVWQRLPMRGRKRDGYVLFLGTLEARKNVGVLLDAYQRLIETDSGAPPLLLAGKQGHAAAGWLERIVQPPLAGRVQHLGYVPLEQREALYAGARLLVMPSRDEGFGMPVLEAMSAGVPVIAANRGALPEVLGAAGMLVNGDDVKELANAMRRMLSDEPFACECIDRGIARAREFSWERAAMTVHEAYISAIARRNARSRTES
jgi:alpha-1,3-rhamnosyl/mannosyltransferase